MDIENSEEEVCPQIVQKEVLGEGTYGVVYKGEHKKTGEVVAIKKVKLEAEDNGIPATTIREIAMLKSLQHPYIVNLLNTYYCQSKKIYLVFEYMEWDLKKYIQTFPEGKMLPRLEVKQIMAQILEGLEFCHAMGVFHRDLKTQNILRNKEGITKIADFGLARAFTQPMRVYTREIVTLWYRSPELLMKVDKYAPEVDIWSVGCIFAELLTKRPLLPGKSQIEQLFKIFEMFGTPTESTWPGVSSLREYKKTFPKFIGAGIDKSVPGLDPHTRDLLLAMLQLNPTERISARKALEHPYFEELIQ